MSLPPAKKSPKAQRAEARWPPAHQTWKLTPKPCLFPYGNKLARDRACQRRSTASGCVRRHCNCRYLLAAQQALSNAPLATSRAHGVDLWQLICVQDKRTSRRRPHEGHVEDEPGRPCHAPGKLQHDPTGRVYSRQAQLCSRWRAHQASAPWWHHARRRPREVKAELISRRKRRIVKSSTQDL